MGNCLLHKSSAFKVKFGDRYWINPNPSSSSITPGEYTLEKSLPDINSTWWDGKVACIKYAVYNLSTPTLKQGTLWGFYTLVKSQSPQLLQGFVSSHISSSLWFNSSNKPMISTVGMYRSIAFTGTNKMYINNCDGIIIEHVMNDATDNFSYHTYSNIQGGLIPLEIWIDTWDHVAKQFNLTR